MKIILAVYAIGGIIGAMWLDWRVALLMLSAWWADNLVTILTDRDSRSKPVGARLRSRLDAEGTRAAVAKPIAQPLPEPSHD